MVRVEITGLENAYSFVRDLPDKLDLATTNSNERFMKDLRITARFKCPKSSGEAAQGLKISRTKQKGRRQQYKLITNVPYTYWIIHGRKRGKAPPIDELLKWTKLDPSAAGQTNKFAAALKLGAWIAKHGTKPNDFIGRAVEHTIVKWDQIINEEFDRSLNK